MSEEPKDQSTKAPAKARQKRVGKVTALSGAKTIRVQVDHLVRHPIYGKYLRKRSKLVVHDPSNAAHVDDVVEIAPCRRVSKRKAWRLVRIVRRGSGVGPLPEQEG